MREIKFRGHNGHDWFFGSLYINEKGECFIDRTHWQREPVIKESVGQYTGLKDKNGKEIYERDIIRVQQLAYGKKSGTEIKEVRWLSTNYNYGFNLREFKCKDYEIIGNVYENPELLKGDK